MVVLDDHPLFYAAETFAEIAEVKPPSVISIACRDDSATLWFAFASHIPIGLRS